MICQKPGEESTWVEERIPKPIPRSSACMPNQMNFEYLPRSWQPILFTEANLKFSQNAQQVNDTNLQHFENIRREISAVNRMLEESSRGWTKSRKEFATSWFPRRCNFLAAFAHACAEEQGCYYLHRCLMLLMFPTLILSLSLSRLFPPGVPTHFQSLFDTQLEPRSHACCAHILVLYVILIICHQHTCWAYLGTFAKPGAKPFDQPHGIMLSSFVSYASPRKLLTPD